MRNFITFSERSDNYRCFFQCNFIFLQLTMSRKSQKHSMLWELLLHAPFVWNVTNCQQMPRPAFHLFF